MGVIRMVWVFLRGLLADRTAFMAKSLVLRQQVNVLRRSVKRPKFRNRDRVFWVWLSRSWSGSRSSSSTDLASSSYLIG